MQLEKNKNIQSYKKNRENTYNGIFAIWQFKTFHEKNGESSKLKISKKNGENSKYKKKS